MDYIEKAKTDYLDLKINLISGANFDKINGKKYCPNCKVIRKEYYYRNNWI